MKDHERKISLLVKDLGSLCKDKRITIVTAESCTGGGLAYFMSKEPDCSAMLERGYVSYSNQAKESLLDVTPNALQIFGPVSKEVAGQMAEGALKNSIAQVAIATSGISGDDFEPADPEKGVAWIACAAIGRKTIIHSYQIKGPREKFVPQAIDTAFKFLLDFIKAMD